jgi:hypothetical protein
VRTQRALAIFLAVMIVLSVALATLGRHPVSLGPLLAKLDPALPGLLKATIMDWFGTWTWSNIALPVLVRPAWLLPASLGILALGGLLSWPGSNTTHRSRRRS